MTESTSERSPRVASTPSRFARLAVRGLAVTGFAGVAWLLSCSAAHASSGAHVKPSGAANSVTRLVTTLGAGSSGNHVGAVRTTPTNLLTSVLPASTATTKASERGTDGQRRTKGGDLLGVTVRGLWRSPVLRSAGTVLRPACGVVSRTKLKRVGWWDIGPANRHAACPARAKPGAPAAVGGFSGVEPTVLGGSQQNAGPLKGGGVTRGAGSRGHVQSGDHSMPVVDDRALLQRTHHVPLLPRPAPLPVLPGSGLTSGVPSTGSDLNQDGGAPAVVPAGTAAALVANHRPDTADDVKIRPLIAESPTVSPD
jgi:hypothetical protein